MQTSLNKINDLVSTLKSLPPISEENQRKLEKKFRLEFNYNSNHLEGNTLSYGETELLLIFDKTDGTHEMREYEEMKAHDVAYKIIHDWAKDTEHPLTETYIKQLNEIILVRPFWKEAITQDGQATKRLIKVGEYKEFPNSVRLQNGELFEYASPIDTPIKMGELMQWYNTEIQKNELHPVALAALLHYKFVCIHPFDDGNGRISRLLMNYVLIKNNLPPIIIKTKDKKNYLNALNQADTGNLEAFVKYIGDQLAWSIQLVTKATKGESVEEVDDLEKEIELFKKAQLSSIQKESIKSDEVVRQCFEQKIEPLISELNSKLLKFKDLFSFLVDNVLIHSYRSGVKPSALANLNSVINQSVNVTEIHWQRTYDKSMNGKINSTILHTRILFEPTFFLITVNNTHVLQKEYNQELLQSELNDTVSKGVKICFELIKSHTKE
jgi:Fic family protein